MFLLCCVHHTHTQQIGMKAVKIDQNNLQKIRYNNVQHRALNERKERIESPQYY